MGKKSKEARARANRAKKRGEEAANPAPLRPPPTTGAREASSAAATAAVSTSKEAAGVADERKGATAAAAAHALDHDTLGKKLLALADDARAVIFDETASWIASEFSGDFIALTAAAEGGDAKAQLAMWFATNISEKEKFEWLHKAMGQGYIDAHLYSGLCLVELIYQQKHEAKLEWSKDGAMHDLQIPAESGLATAQHATSMMLYIFNCDSGSKADFRHAARWIRKAARQGLDVAQYELGKIFCRGLFTDSVEPFLARKYLNLAADQGHAEAIARLAEMRHDGFRCVLCGAADAPNACSYCPKARYCDMECSIAHWRHGGGFASTLGAAEEPHRTGRRASGRSLAARAARLVTRDGNKTVLAAAGLLIG